MLMPKCHLTLPWGKNTRKKNNLLAVFGVFQCFLKLSKALQEGTISGPRKNLSV